MRALVLAAALTLGGCASVERIGPVTVTRSIDIGLWRRCLGAGIGVAFCQQVSFDPRSCALVIVFPKPPPPGVRGALRSLAHEIRAECPETETTP